MPKLSGIFSNFADLDNLTAQELYPWLRAKEQAFYLENFIGNRILYPQTIPSNLSDAEIDLAILREFIKKNPIVVYSDKLKKMIIPEDLIVRFPPLQKLLSALLDVLTLEEVTQVLLKRYDSSTEVAGTVIRIFYQEGESFSDVNINGQILKLEFESTTILPNKDPHIVVQIDSQPALNVAGGSLGLVIDLRKA
jgi:hypothetical protein